MADNKTLTLSVAMSYQDAEGVSKSSTIAASIEYAALIEGGLDVPAGSSAAVDVPFADVDSATCVTIHNNTDVELDLLVNTTATFSLPPGGVFVAGAGGVLAGTPISALKATPTGAATLGGQVAFKVFGDPVFA